MIFRTSSDDLSIALLVNVKRSKNMFKVFLNNVKTLFKERQITEVNNVADTEAN